MIGEVIGYEFDDAITRNNPITALVVGQDALYVPHAEVRVFSEPQLAKAGLVTQSIIEDGKFVGKVMVDTKTGFTIPLDCKDIVSVKTNPKFDARTLKIEGELKAAVENTAVIGVSKESVKDSIMKMSKSKTPVVPWNLLEGFQTMSIDTMEWEPSSARFNSH